MRLTVAFLAATLGAPSAFAAFDDVPFGARDAAMGGSLAAVHDEVSAVAYNPAALGQVRVLEAAASYLRSFHSPAGEIDRDNTRAAAALPVRQEIFDGAFGFDVRYDRRTGVSRDRQIGLFYGTRGLRETEGGGLDLGGGLKVLSSSLEGGGSIGPRPAVDLGALWRFGDRHSLGASLLNLGGAKFRLGGYADRAPLALKIGAAESVRGALLAVDATVREPSAGRGRSLSFAAGFERWWASSRAGAFAARSGLSLGDRSRTWHCGFGWKQGGGRLDYAMSVPLSGARRLGHGLTLTLLFGRPDPAADYERLLESEMKARADLNRALDAGALKQWKLSEEISRLQAEVVALRESLVGKSAAEVEARRRLQEIEARQRKAAETFRRLQEEQARSSAKTKAELFREDWGAYQRAKLGGAANAALLERVERLLLEYRDSGADLGEASQELRRLQQSR